MNVALIPLTGTEERLMRVDKQQRMPRSALGRRDCPHIRADLGLESFVNCNLRKVGEPERVAARSRRGRAAYLADGGFDFVYAEPRLAEDEKLIERESAERERIPGLKVSQQPGFYLRVLFEEIIQGIGMRLRQFLYSRACLLVLGDRQLCYVQSAIEQIVIQCFLAVDLARSSKRSKIAVLHLPEIVLRLCVNKPENATRVGRPIHVRNAVGIPVDRYRPSNPFGSRVSARGYSKGDKK